MVMNKVRIFINLLMKFLLNLTTTFSSIIRIVLFSGFKPKIKSIDIDDKNECYILGNGPSLTVDIMNNIEFLSHKYIITVNFFVFSEVYGLV